MLITFSGLDGAGKSTQVKFVVNWLQQRGFQPKFLHLTQWTWVYQIGEKLGGKEVGRRETAVSTAPPSLPVQLLRQIISLVDLLRFKLMWWQLKRNNSFLVCDRYFYDLGINALYRQTMHANTVNFMWKHAPIPDLAFFLDVLPDVAEAREGEHAPEYYVQKRHLFLESIPAWQMVMLPPKPIAQTQAQIALILADHIKSFT
ncbi:MAG: hypothetical protein GY943_06845 [Chloroflexi bacterium]|nr:hypothetical protein [Chloroflexota bacterium]